MAKNQKSYTPEFKQQIVDLYNAVKTVDEAVRLNATDPDSLQNLYRQTYADVPLLPPLENTDSMPQQKVIPFRNDLTLLDAALKKGGASNG